MDDDAEIEVLMSEVLQELCCDPKLQYPSLLLLFDGSRPKASREHRPGDNGCCDDVLPVGHALTNTQVHNKHLILSQRRKLYEILPFFLRVGSLKCCLFASHSFLYSILGFLFQRHYLSQLQSILYVTIVSFTNALLSTHFYVVTSGM